MVGVAEETVRRLGHLAAQGDLRGVKAILEPDVDWLDAFDHRGATALIRAVENNRVEVVRYLLSKGADVNLATADLWTPLHHCVSKDRGFIECLELILSAKRVKVNAGNSDGNAPLNLCAMNNFEDCAQLLLGHGANPNRVNNAMWSPIMQACSKGRGYANMIDVLVQHGADVDLAKDDGDTALGLCCLNGFLDCAKVLLSHGARVNTQKSNQWTPLMHCCGKGRGHADIAKLLLDSGADYELLNNDGNSALAICCMNGFADIANLLLECGASVDRQSKGGWSMLHQTVCKGRGTAQHRIIADALINAGIDINLKNHELNTALNLAAMNGFGDIAALLVEAGAEVNNQANDGWSPLHCTVGSGRGYTDIAKLVIAHGADVNARNKQGLTPLGLCAMNNFKEIAALLINAGADIDSSSDSGWTALMEAVASGRGHKTIAKMLIEAGANLNIQNVDGFSALHLAALHNFHRIATMIVKTGRADLDLQESKGWTPLHCACSENRGYVKIARLLLENGCEVNTIDHDGLNAVFLCVDWDAPPELMVLLKEYGGDVNLRLRAGLTPLLVACENGNFAMVRQLVELDADLESPSFPVDLRTQCPQGHPLVEYHSEEGSNFCNLCGARHPPLTPLRACRECDYDVCRTCASSRGEVHSLPSALDMARKLEHTEIVRFLESLRTEGNNAPMPRPPSMPDFDVVDLKRPEVELESSLRSLSREDSLAELSLRDRQVDDLAHISLQYRRPRQRYQYCRLPLQRTISRVLARRRLQSSASGHT